MFMQKETFDIDALRGLTPATVRAAFNRSEEIMEEHGDMGDANASSIVTRVIRDAGRFSERWSSDVMFGLNHILDVAHKTADLSMGPFDEILAFGIRQDGVDCCSFLMQRLQDTLHRPTGYVHPGQIYRRILAVRIRVKLPERGLSARAEFSLRDISSSIHRFEAADLKENGIDLVQLPLPDGKSPVPSEDAEDRVDRKKALERGFREFACRGLGTDMAAADGWPEGTRVIEIYGLPEGAKSYSGRQDGAVARAYGIPGMETVPVVWLDPWYEHYDAARFALDAARRVLGMEGAAPDPAEIDAALEEYLARTGQAPAGGQGGRKTGDGKNGKDA